MQLILGIDDTDNLNTRGTGFRARELGTGLQNAGLAVLKGVVRHQLLVHPDIPYTSHNSSASIWVETQNADAVWEFSKHYLISIAADGSDAGLCCAGLEQINDDIQNWGLRAKQELLTMDEAYLLAAKNNIRLEGFTGHKTGIIGSLAAVGLRVHGNDGRFLLITANDIRDVLPGLYSFQTLGVQSGIQCFLNLDSDLIPDTNDKICIDDWMRPLLRNREICLAIQPAEHNDYQWINSPKKRVKELSE